MIEILPATEIDIRSAAITFDLHDVFLGLQDIEAGFMRSVRGLVEDLTKGRQKPYHDSNLREGFLFYQP